MSGSIGNRAGWSDYMVGQSGGREIKPHVVFTIGHSTRPVDEFISLLQRAEATLVADIRRYPGSRRNPQFSQAALATELAKAGIDYAHFPELGGRRKPPAESRNAGWKNKAFQGYADHMATPEFEEGLARLIDLAGREHVAVMCAEAVPWRCHRTLLADALVVRGLRVKHIISETDIRPHELTTFSRVEEGRLFYPG